MELNSGLLHFTEPRVRPGTYLADPRDLESPAVSDYRKLLQHSLSGSVYGRKNWEWDFIASSAESLGLLKPNVSALGLGCGLEHLIYYFARSCGAVIATDLYGQECLWDVAAMKDQGDFHKFSLFDYRREATKFLSADMRSIPQPDGSQDFIWSTSSIEHVDTLADCYRITQEVARLLKPGGYAILTTEFVLSPSPYLLPNLNALNEELLQAFYVQNPAFELVGPYDLSHTWGHPAAIPMPRREIRFLRSRKATPAIQQRDYRLVVGHSILTPIGFVVRRTPEPCPSLEQVVLSPLLQRVLALTEAAKKAPSITVLEQLFELLEQGDRDVPLQLKMNLGVYACSLVTQACPSPAFMRKFVDRAFELIPDGAVQDADFLDCFSHVLLACGLKREACQVLEKALSSPGALYDHVVAMAGRHLLISSTIGRRAESVTLLQPYLADFIERGIKTTKLTSIVSSHCGVSPADAEVLVGALVGQHVANGTTAR